MNCLRIVVAAVCLFLVGATSSVGAQHDPRRSAAGVQAAPADQPPSSSEQEQPSAQSKGQATRDLCFARGDQRICGGLDFSFASVCDGSQRAAMGRERQIKPAFLILSAYGDINPFVSFVVELNPASDSRKPEPYVPSPDDRRTYFFPNQPDQPGSRGVVSNPEGLYKVDDYKHPGLDPIIQKGALRVAYADLHARSRRFGARIGRFYPSQGLGLSHLVWFTAKDLPHIALINAQADNGLAVHWASGRFRVELAAVTGNANPYHDYGYFDFTDATEDKNSALGGIGDLQVDLWNGRLLLGGSYRKNFINSRIEDSISLQLSKHNDDAVLVYGSVQPARSVRVFGEYARYKWGLASSSAVLLPGPPVETPVYKPGYYVGADLCAPQTRFGRWGGTVIHEELSRDDALVAWAAANGLFGVQLGEKERSTILKVHATFFESLTGFFFYNRLTNPFPELSAIRPISGAGSDQAVSNNKYGLGFRLHF